MSVAAFRAILHANTGLHDLLGDRVYPFGGVPAAADRPYVEAAIASSTPSYDLAGNIECTLDAISARIVDDDYDGVAAIRALLPACFASARGSFGGVTVADCEVTESSDSSDGPVDIDERRAFEGLATVVIVYS